MTLARGRPVGAVPVEQNPHREGCHRGKGVGSGRLALSSLEAQAGRQAVVKKGN